MCVYIRACSNGQIGRGVSDILFPGVLGRLIYIKLSLYFNTLKEERDSVFIPYEKILYDNDVRMM